MAKKSEQSSKPISGTKDIILDIYIDADGKVKVMQKKEDAKGQAFIRTVYHFAD